MQIEQKPLSYFFDCAVVEEMVELLEGGYTVPCHGFGAFSGPGNQWCYVLMRNGDRRVFSFGLSLPFSVGIDGKPDSPTFEELFIEGLENLLKEITRLEA